MIRYDAMLSYVPMYYHTSNIYKGILSAEGSEMDLLGQNMEDLQAQFFVDTATWSLGLWEKEYGMSVNPSLSYEDRRARLKGKIRGIEKINARVIKSVAQAFSNGEVDVSFDGRIRIKFTGTRGIPAELDELKRQLSDIVQAHIETIYEFTYLTWKEFDMLTAQVQESMTWAQLEVYKPFSTEKRELMWNEFDVLNSGVQESMTWNNIEVFEP